MRRSRPQRSHFGIRLVNHTQLSHLLFSIVQDPRPLNFYSNIRVRISLGSIFKCKGFSARLPQSVFSFLNPWYDRPHHGANCCGRPRFLPQIRAPSQQLGSARTGYEKTAPWYVRRADLWSDIPREPALCSLVTALLPQTRLT